IPTGLQIEHVMPQAWSAHWPIGEVTVSAHQAAYPSSLDAEQPELAEAIRARNAAINRLGNLTLLNLYANPAASNGGYAVKRNEYKHSVLRINRYFDDRNYWDEVTIRERGRMLGERLLETWPREVPQ
ncbi:MAG: HNH endonuclease family protein, partial [Caulobacteraceae bacterium]